MTKHGETVKVEGYERRKPTTQKPRTDNESQISDAQPQKGVGVQIIGKGERGPQGVQRLSRREAGDLETTIEVSTDQNKRDNAGRRVFEQ